MSAEPGQNKLPYPSQRSFNNYLEHLKTHPLPSRIDKSVMSHLNHGTQMALLGALRILGLISKDDAPTPRLEKLVGASAKERGPILAEMLKETYPYFWDGSIDLGRATSGEFGEKLRSTTGATGSTLIKGGAFFLAMAAEAGLKLSPHLTAHKAPSGTGAKRPKARPKKIKAPRQLEKPPIEEEETLAGGDLTARLLAKFPAFDPTWVDAIKKQWFDGFEKLMSSAAKAKK